MSPLAEWHVVSLQHKLAVGTAGAGAAWYFHKYLQWPTWKVALGAFGVAYGTSVVLNAARRFSVPLGLPAVASMPPTQFVAGQPVYSSPVSVPPGTPQPTFSDPGAFKPQDFNAPLDLGVQNKKVEMDVEEGFAGDDGIFS
jgi:hypothetical protein